MHHLLNISGPKSIPSHPRPISIMCWLKELSSAAGFVPGLLVPAMCFCSIIHPPYHACAHMTRTCAGCVHACLCLIPCPCCIHACVFPCTTPAPNAICRYGSTGVLLAITCAVALRPPRAAWPVMDLDSLVALPARNTSGGTGQASCMWADIRAQYISR